MTHDVRELVRMMQPVASAYLGRRAQQRQGALEPVLRRQHIAKYLYGQDAANGTIDAAVGFLARLPEGSSEYAVFTGESGILLSCHLPGGMGEDMAAYTAPAKIAPVLAWWQRHPGYVLLAINESGVQLTAVPRGAVTGSVRTALRPHQAGGEGPGRAPSPMRLREAELIWRDDVEVDSEAVVAELDRLNTDLLLVTGDEQLIDSLVRRLRLTGRNPSIQYLPRGRDHDVIEINHTVDAHSRQGSMALLAQVEREQGARGTAVAGAEQTLRALAGGLVHTLLCGQEAGSATHARRADRLRGARLVA